MFTTSPKQISGDAAVAARTPISEIGYLASSVKVVSTYLCDCIDNAGRYTVDCRGRCWEWQLFDFEETIAGWWSSAGTNRFEFLNFLVMGSDGGFARHSGFVQLDRIRDVFDFMVSLADDIAVMYPLILDGKRDLRVWQHSPYEMSNDMEPQWSQARLSPVTKEAPVSARITEWRPKKQIEILKGHAMKRRR